MAHEPGNVERRRDDADAVANDLTGQEKGIHVGTLRASLFDPGTTPAPTAGPCLRMLVCNPGSTLKTSEDMENRQSNAAFLGRLRHGACQQAAAAWAAESAQISAAETFRVALQHPTSRWTSPSTCPKLAYGRPRCAIA